MNDKLHALLIALAGAGVALLGKWLIDVITRRQERRANSAYLAVRVVYDLDRFTRACFDIATDDGPSLETYQTYTPAAPPSFAPQDLPVDWKSIDVKLTYQVLNLPSDQAAIEDQVRNRYGGQAHHVHDAAFMRAGEYAALGVRAASLALTLREIGDLPAPEQDLLGLMTVARDSHAAEEMRRETQAAVASAVDLYASLPAVRTP